MQTTTLGSALQIIQIIISVALIVVIILQARGMGLGSLFGGDSGMGITKTRRGLEKTLFRSRSSSPGCFWSWQSCNS